MAALNDILAYLIQTISSLFLIAVMLRFILQLVRADFYNPISQFLVKLTNPVVIPLRRLIPGFAGLDIASLLLAIIVQLLALAATIALGGFQMPPIGLMLVWSVLGILGLLVNIYFFALLAMIIVSWIAPGSQNPALYLLHQITEPVMAPMRKIVPAMGGIDFSPIFLFILIGAIEIALGHLAVGVGLPSNLIMGI